MCSIKEKSNLKEFTGYKVVVTDKHGHHYSPYTGVRYQVGVVPSLPKTKRKYTAWIDYCTFHDYLHIAIMADNRLTAVFKYKSTAKIAYAEIVQDKFQYFKLPKKCKYNIIELTVSGDIYNGRYDGNEIIAGNIIKSIKLCK